MSDPNSKDQAENEGPTTSLASNSAPEPTAVLKPKYSVFVDDNFHYMDESERYLLGEFETRDEAIQAAKAIVDKFLIRGYEEGMSAEKLHEQYRGFGEDPYISPRDEDSPFSAWKYAESRCQELCDPTRQTKPTDDENDVVETESVEIGKSTNLEPAFSDGDLMYFGRDETICWPCRPKDIICWLRTGGIFDEEWKILDFWQCFDGDMVTITNRIADFPSGFALHPLERKGPSAPREISAELVNNSEYIEAPNLWKAQAGDRILWVGEPRTWSRSIEQILGLVELSQDALAARYNNRSASELGDYLEWASGCSGDDELPQELVLLLRHGLSVAKRLGGPNSLSVSEWGIG